MTESTGEQPTEGAPPVDSPPASPGVPVADTGDEPVNLVITTPWTDGFEVEVDGVMYAVLTTASPVPPHAVQPIIDAAAKQGVEITNVGV